MTRRSLIQTIPRVPSNLPVFFNALITEVIHSSRLGFGKENHLEERQPRQGLTAIIEPVGPKLPAQFNMTIFIELIPLANSVEVYLETGVMAKGVLRLMRGLTEKMFDQVVGREIVDAIGRTLALESQNYVMPLQGGESGRIQPAQTNNSSESSPITAVYCPACGLANPAQARFCETCGTKLAR